MTLVLLCNGKPEHNSTEDFDAMDWKQIRDAVAKHIPTTTESIVHHYVQQIAHKFDGAEDRIKDVVKNEVNYVTDGVSDFL
ncbi:unnamed protein product [Orchesella dallaii]|uniref:Uncharacterized protein n=1 Tax=Orchesella dallaii TaxID=48710 RepID=A0ABP1PJ27_9HEXA